MFLIINVEKSYTLSGYFDKFLLRYLFIYGHFNLYNLKRFNVFKSLSFMAMEYSNF